jgi:hypothetical protein
MKHPLFLLSILTSLVCYSSFYCCSYGSYSCGSYWLVSPYIQKPFVLLKNELLNSNIGLRVRDITMRASRSPSGSGEDVRKGKQKTLAPKYSPKTANQKIYCDCLSDANASIILGIGPAGTGKTLFACTTAIELLRRGEIHKIVLTRPVVAVEEELGFLPGNMVMKMDPWTRPIFDIFLEYYAQKDIDAMVQSGVIEISPLAYMRGRTFKRAFIIADEMQNSSPNQMLMLITRIGDGAKMVITGDLKQSDRMTDNGLQDLLRKIYRRAHINLSPTLRESGGAISLGGIRAVEFASKDIERSAIVKQVLDLYEPTPSLTPSINQTLIKNESLDTNTSSIEITYDDMNMPIPVHISNEYELVSPTDAVSFNDAALIPKQHNSKFFGEDYGQYSSGKWTGW